MQTAFKLRPWAITDLASLVKHANNWNVAKNMTDKFPFPYSESDGRGFIAFATQGDPVHIFAIEVGGQAVGGIGIHAAKRHSSAQRGAGLLAGRALLGARHCQCRYRAGRRFCVSDLRHRPCICPAVRH